MKKGLWLVVLFQAAWIFGLSAFHESRLQSGVPILLKTVPVDPRDLLRGDYVILRYSISDVPLNLFDHPELLNAPGQKDVYVLLEKKGKFHEAVGASTRRLQAGPGQVLCRGELVYNRRSGTNVHVAYGLERYYVPEGAGNPSGQLTVEARVDADGRPALKEVFIDGEPYLDVMARRKKQ